MSELEGDLDIVIRLSIRVKHYTFTEDNKQIIRNGMPPHTGKADHFMREYIGTPETEHYVFVQGMSPPRPPPSEAVRGSTTKVLKKGFKGKSKSLGQLDALVLRTAHKKPLFLAIVVVCAMRLCLGLGFSLEPSWPKEAESGERKELWESPKNVLRAPSSGECLPQFREAVGSINDTVFSAL